tara:strand:- start:188 stop:1219 length:1032 start_codon:yes stop_codon:yes gene_type:complete
MKKNILLTGNLGYIGTVLTEILIKDYNIIGLDSGLYEEDILKDEVKPTKQIKKDIRFIEDKDLNGIDYVIHLAALSNDPLGEFDPNLTKQINYMAAKKLIDLSKKNKIERFVYISSQSMYGISKETLELDEDNSEKNPATEYAKTKWETEKYLFSITSEDFISVALRPSTVFGASPRLRCDIVFNNLLACAYTTNKIEIKSDGTPWRPVIHVRDVCSAIIACLNAPKKLINKKSFNIGIKNGNYQVKDIAKVVEKKIPNCKIIFTGEHLVDPRSYKVSFKRILNDLKDFYKPEWNLDSGADELIKFFDEINFKESDFRGSKTNRISSLKEKLKKNLKKDLTFK